MNTFKKKSLYAAVAGLGALTAAGMAQAVNVNPDGLGQVLIYPYYTVRSTASGAAYNSLLSVVNSTASAKAVKVRFLEGNNSREVLDFNLFLSAHDVWVAAVIPTANGAGVFTPDNSCTVPAVSKDPANPTPFVNFAYTGSSNADGGDTSLDRTREGYVEIIEMADIVTGTPTYTTVTHVSSVPPCKASILQSPNLTTVNPQLDADTVAGSGGLFGGITLVSALAPSDVATEATALDAFSISKLLAPEGSIQPNLARVNPPVSVVTNGSNTYITDWGPFVTSNPADAVSAVLMHNNVYNEFILDAGTKSGTDWVVTMPTKWSYYAGGQISDSSGNIVGVALTPGQTLFQRNFMSGKACDDVGITRYDREENTVVSQTTFSPPPPTQTDSICYEANVITFSNSNVLASKNVANIPTTFANGWAGLNFSVTSNGRHQLIGGASTTFNTNTGTTGSLTATQFVGLPTIGFAVETFNNGTLTDSTGAAVNSAYAGRFAHRFTRSIQQATIATQ
jgi:hypothetical protein